MVGAGGVGVQPIEYDGLERLLLLYPSTWL